MLLSTAAEAAAITTAATQASKKAFIRILHNLARSYRSPEGLADDRR
jgi:hypothetical protein